MTKRSGTLADTLYIDVLLDSAKAEVARGETETPVTLSQKAIALLEAIDRKDDGSQGLHQRFMHAYKFEAIAHHYADRYAPALAGFLKMEQEAITLGNATEVAAALTYQGYEYRATGDLSRASEVTQRAIAALRKLPESKRLANALAGLAIIYTDLDQWDSAMYYHRASAAMHRRLGNATLEALSLMDIAALYTDKQRYDSAYAELQLAKPVLMADSNVTQHVILLIKEARVLIGLGRIPEARHNLAIAGPLARQIGADESIQRMQELLALVAAADGKYPEAIQALDSARAAMLRDLDVAKVQEVTAVRMKADQDKQQAQAAMELKLERDRKHNAFIGGLLVLAIAALLARLLYVARRNETQLRAKNQEIVEAHEQAMQAEKQREAEQVRTRIARDIHDDIGSGLTKITLLGNEAKVNMQVSVEALVATLDRIITHSREVGAALGDIVWAVDPAHDTSIELVSHARLMAQRLLDGTGVAHEFRIAHIDPAHPVTPGTKHHIVMVMKEAINNALKYAGAIRITVELEAGAHHFMLHVKDDGKGFDPAAMATAGNGLRNMQARSEAIGSMLTVESSLGCGCTVRMEGPLT